MPLPPRFIDCLSTGDSSAPTMSRVPATTARSPARPVSLIQRGGWTTTTEPLTPAGSWTTTGSMILSGLLPGHSASGGSWRALEHYRGWTYVCLKKICDRFSEPFPYVGYRVQRAVGEPFQLVGQRRRHVEQRYGGEWLQSVDDDLEPTGDHPLVTLLSHPNPVDSYSDLAAEAALFWQLTGQTWLWVVPNALGLPAALYIVPPHWVCPIVDTAGHVVRYQLQGAGRPIEVPADELHVLRNKSPWSKQAAFSVLDAGASWIQTADAIETSRLSQFQQGFNPDVVIELDSDRYQSVTEDVLRRISEKFIRLSSGARRAGAPTYVPPGIRVNRLSNSPREMEYAESAGQARDQNLALHGVPPIIAGASSDYNRATAETAAAVFAEYTLNPLFRRWAGFLTRTVAARFDPELRLWFDDSRPLSREFELEQDQADFRMGAITPNELRRKRNRPTLDQPELDRAFVGSSSPPVSQ